MLILQPPKADRRVPSRFERLVLSLNAASTVARLRSCLLLGCYQGQTVPMRSWWRGDSDGGEDGDLRAACDVIRDAHPGQFDGIIGFSQGGALAALLAATRSGGWGAGIPSLQMLQFLIVAGAYAVPGFPRALRDLDGLPTLHLMSLQDTCVNCSASQELARLFPGATSHMHEQARS